MIGGYDWFGELAHVEPADIDLLLRSLAATWQDAVLEHEVDGHVAPVVSLRGALRLSWAVPCEFYVYETKQALDDWNNHGLTATNADKMIYVQAEQDGFACVINAPNSASKELVESAVEAVRRNRRILLNAAA